MVKHYTLIKQNELWAAHCKLVGFSQNFREPPSCRAPTTYNTGSTTHHAGEGKKERKQQTYCRCRYHRVVDLTAMSWIWPEEKKDSRLAMDPARGEEGQPSRGRSDR